MSDLVVVDNEHKVVVSDTATSAIIVSPAENNIVVWGQMGPPGLSKISLATDIDTSALTDGSILIYNSTTSTWVASPDVKGGVNSVDGNTDVVTALQILNAVKKEDGTGSGLDADLLDGLDTSSTYTPNTVMTRDADGATGLSVLNFDTSQDGRTSVPGMVWWDNQDGNQTLNIGMQDDVTQQVGLETYFRVKASSPITNGQVVMATGTVGNSGAITAAPAQGLTPDTAIYILGVATQDIAQGSFGYITNFGLVRGINTTNIAENWTDGTVLYYDPDTIGGLTKYLHSAPIPKVVVAMVVKAHTNGSLFIRVSHGSVLGGTDGNVEFTSLQDKDQIVYNGTLGRWENKSLIGNDIDQILSITKSITLTTDWQDVGISGTDLATGTYIVQLFANDSSSGGVNVNEYYSGTMSWYSGSTNTSIELPTDEIVLHRAGASSDAGMYLRTYRTDSTGVLKLQIYSNISNPSSANYVFKFRRMI